MASKEKAIARCGELEPDDSGRVTLGRICGDALILPIRDPCPNLQFGDSDHIPGPVLQAFATPMSRMHAAVWGGSAWLRANACQRELPRQMGTTAIFVPGKVSFELSKRERCEAQRGLIGGLDCHFSGPAFRFRVGG